MANKRILIIGGEDSHKRVPISNILANNGFEVSIAGSKPFKCPDHITFIPYFLNRKLNLLSDFRTIGEIGNILSKGNFDIVQTFDTKPAFLVPLASKKNKVAIIRTITGLGTVFMSKSIKYKILKVVYILLHRLVSNKVTFTTFQNTDDRQFYLDNKLVSPDKSSLIFGSGIELNSDRKKAKREKSPFTFICVARLVYEKGIVNYLEAAEICKNKGYSFKFLLIGPLEENTKRLNHKILEKYLDIVEWMGERKDVTELMLKSDAFVLPTFREGLSRVILEACAVGIPTITTNVPGTRDIIRNEVEGLHVNLNDSIDLAEKMIQIATSPDFDDQWAQNAYFRAEEFSLDVISKEYINLYNENTPTNKKNEHPVFSTLHQ